jgi:hypothetical protein
MRKQNLQVADTILYNAKLANGGRLPYGKMDEILMGLEKGGLKVSKDNMNHRLRRYKPIEVTRLPLQTVNTEQQSNVSSLSGARGAEDEDGEANNRNKGGRPKGTTLEYLRKQELNKKECINAIAQDYQAELDNSLQSERKRNPKRTRRQLATVAGIRQIVNCCRIP